MQKYLFLILLLITSCSTHKSTTESKTIDSQILEKVLNTIVSDMSKETPFYFMYSEKDIANDVSPCMCDYLIKKYNLKIHCGKAIVNSDPIFIRVQDSIKNIDLYLGKRLLICDEFLYSFKNQENHKLFIVENEIKDLKAKNTSINAFNVYTLKISNLYSKKITARLSTQTELPKEIYSVVGGGEVIYHFEFNEDFSLNEFYKGKIYE